MPTRHFSRSHFHAFRRRGLQAGRFVRLRLGVANRRSASLNSTGDCETIPESHLLVAL